MVSFNFTLHTTLQAELLVDSHLLAVINASSGVTSATYWSRQQSASLPCFVGGSVVAVHFTGRDDLPTAAVSGEFALGERHISTSMQSAWLCQAVSQNASSDSAKQVSLSEYCAR
jgi:hypothetical protein